MSIGMANPAEVALKGLDKIAQGNASVAVGYPVLPVQGN
jgi:hypothetical protein